MLETIRKNFIVIISTLLLLGLVFLAAKQEDTDILYFQVQNHSDHLNITVFDAQDGNYYVFLPSYASLDYVRVILPYGQKLFLDDIRLTHKMSCDVFELEHPYSFSVDGRKLATLWFYQSQNVATLHIDTASGDMTKIHEDKNFQESASMTLHLPDGSINYIDNKCKLKGRGNSTWDCAKIPYLLTLSGNGDLLGMGSAKKWVLLANAYDETNLNNKLIFDLASQVGFAWSPECQYVDLYLNGEYNGLYLLSEKIEVSPNRINIDTASGEYLCKVDTPSRADRLKNFFESSQGRIIEICLEDSLSVLDSGEISYGVYQMEKEIQSGTDLSNSELLDLDSWVRRYLIDEISGNIDSDLTSSYFYFSDGKYYAGPIWDYDITLGNSLRNQEPHAFIAKNEMKRNDRRSVYYNALYQNESFYNRMLEIYREDFSPVLKKLADHGLQEQIELIHASAKMNSIRWREMYDEWIEITADLGIVRSAEDVKSYFVNRVRFLDNAWLEGTDFCTVQFEQSPGSAYWNISAETGTILETTYLDLINTVWVDMQSEEPVDFRNPITRDMIVKPQAIS